MTTPKDPTIRLHPPAPPAPAGDAQSPALSPPGAIEGAAANPNDPVSVKVRKVLSLIRPAVQADGGDIELVGITPENVVQIRMHGACVDCPSSSVTLQTGIARNLRQHVPEIKGVEAVD